MRKKIGQFCMLTGIVLVAAALSLFLYNQYANWQSGRAAAQVMPELQEQIFEETEDADELSVLEINGYSYIGYLSIPVLELELPIMEDWSYPQLKIAPCRYHGSIDSHNLVIAGHNYKRHFGQLHTLTAGDLAVFTDMDGRQYTYEVAEVEILEPSAVTEMLNSAYDLTLYTCTYGGQNRVTVRLQQVYQ